jgi:putative ABC transport system permease protein
VGGDYFYVMSVPVKAGRAFDDSDAAPGAASVVVSESLARATWGDADPIGRRVSDGQTPGARVVGVVGDVRHWGPETPPVQALYRPLAQRGAWGGTLVVLTDRDPTSLTPALREDVRALDGSVVFQRARTMGEIVRSRTAAPRFVTTSLTGFGGAGLLLAAIGVYAVIAFSVGQRTREIGLRLALGAERGRVLRMVLREGLWLSSLGVVIGLLGAVGLSRYLRSLLFEVSPLDPTTYAVAALLAVSVALVACLVPALRAARVDPMVALRNE